MPKNPTIEHIVPHYMLWVNQLMEQAAINNETFNGKNLINTYVCRKCLGTIVTIDLHVGATPYAIPCLETFCDSEAISNGYKILGRRIHKTQYEGQIDLEFYRPLTPLECLKVQDLFSYPHRGEANEIAKHLLSGNLISRPYSQENAGMPDRGDVHTYSFRSIK